MPLPRPPSAPRPGILPMLGAILERPGNAVSPAAARGWCRAWSGGGGGGVLIILCLSVYLPGLLSIPPVDRDESRFAQASRTMLDSGDYIVPRIQDKPRLNKPPLIYWLQAASARVLGDAQTPDGMGQWGNGNIWVYRLPSVLCAIGSVLLTWRLGLRLFDPRAAVLAAALLALCPMVIWDAHQARADQLLLFTTTGTMFALFVCWKNSRTHTQGVARAARLPVMLQQRFLWPVAFWTFLALGILAKGPVTPLIAALAIISLSISTRSLRWTLHLRPLLGLLIIAALVGPWVYLVSRQVGWSAYWPIILKETIGRSTDAAENHWGPPGYHTLLLTALFWPGSLLTLAAIIRAIHRVRTRPGAVVDRSVSATRAPSRLNARPELFLLSWLLPAWLLFECIATKLPHYTMPLYPAIALLTARAILAALAGSLPQLQNISARIGLALWCAIGFFGLSLGLILIAAAGSIREYISDLHLALAALYLILLAVMLSLAHRAAARGHWLRAHAIAIVAIVSWCWITLAAILPASQDLWASRRITDLLARSSTLAAPPIALVGYQEDSLLFLLRARATRLDAVQLPDWLTAHPDGLLAIDALQYPEAAKSAASSRSRAGSVDGYNYSTGKRIHVEVYAPRPLPVSQP